MAKNLLALARALFGFFRFNAGVFLLKVWFGLRRYSKRPPDFHSGWRVAKKLGWLFRGREFVANRFRQHWYQFAMSKLMAEFRNHDISEFPEIVVIGDNLLQKVFEDGSPPLIVLSPHRRCNAIAAVLKRYDPNLVCIAKSPRATDAAKRYGGTGDLDIVAISPYTLVEARSKIRAGQAIKADPDFTERRPGWLYQDIFVSVGLFRLAIVCRANLIFAISQVLEDGTVQVKFEMPDVEIQKSQPHTLANRFVKFSVEQDRRLVGMKVENPNSNILYPSRRLYDFCVSDL